MDIEKKRNEIRSKVQTAIEEKLGLEHFCITNLEKEYRGEEGYEDNLAAFRYALSLGEEGEIFIWDDYMLFGLTPSNFCAEDFTEDEMRFFESMAKTRQEAISNLESTSVKANINEPIETDRLVLKAFSDETSGELDNYFYDNKAEWEDFHARDYPESFDFSFMHKRRFIFGIHLKGSDKLVGCIGLSDLNEVLFNVAYFIMAAYRKKGYAYEALEALIKRVKGGGLLMLSETVRRWTFNVTHPDIRCLRIQADVTNIASQKMAEKAGFKKNGTLLFDGLIRNEYHDQVVYDLLLNEDKTVPKK